MLEIKKQSKISRLFSKLYFLFVFHHKKAKWFCGNCEKMFRRSKLEIDDEGYLVCPKCHNYVEI